MTIPNEIKEVLLAQHRADTLQQVQAALNDGTKVLNDSVISDLLHFASKTAYASDDTMPGRVAQHHYQIEKLKSRLNAHASSIDILKKQLADIRTYLNVGTDEQLSAAVAAGRKYVAVPKTEADKLIELAKQRAAEAREKAAQSQKQ